MDKREEFKAFVKKNPNLIKFVKSGEMTWQKFFEIYDLYGEDETALKDFLAVSTVTPSIMSLFKNFNLDSIQEGVNNLERVVSVVGDLTNKEETTKETYRPRPLYKHFED